MKYICISYHSWTLRWHWWLKSILVEDKDMFIQSIPLLLMSWRYKEPGYLQPWYWPSYPVIFLFQHQKGPSSRSLTHPRSADTAIHLQSRWPMSRIKSLNSFLMVSSVKHPSRSCLLANNNNGTPNNDSLRAIMAATETERVWWKSILATGLYLIYWGLNKMDLGCTMLQKTFSI